MQVCLLAMLRGFTSIRQKEKRAERAPFWWLFFMFYFPEQRFFDDLVSDDLESFVGCLTHKFLIRSEHLVKTKP